MLWLKLAARNLLRHTRRSILTGLALAAGYILFSLAISVTLGTYGNLIEIFTRDHTGHIQVLRDGYLEKPTVEDSIAEPAEVRRLILEVDGVQAAAPRVQGPGLAYSDYGSLPVQVIGVDPVLEPQVTRLKDKVKAGSFLTTAPDSDGVHGAMIGAGVAESLKVGLGDELILISQGADGSVANDRFKVNGLVGTPDSHETHSVYLSLSTAQEFFSLGERAHVIAALVEDQTQAKDRARAIESVLSREGAAGKGLEVAPWQRIEEEFSRAMETDMKGNSITIVILMFIVGIGVLNTVLMSILERTREFGVLRAIGTRPGGIFQMIVLESLVLSSMACAAGALVAWLVNRWFELEGITMPEPIEMGGIVYDRMLGTTAAITFWAPALLTVGVALLVSAWPAWRAGHVDPVQAIRSQ